jgi:DNA-binding response OmpR family regulator
MFSIFRAARISDVAPHLSFSEQKKRVKIVVVDDDPRSFPTAHLQEDGYTIDAWTKIDAARLQRLENGDYDIVILDIMGITDHSVSETGDGLGVLKRIKSVNPNQVVVAFSGNSYDLSKVPFWEMADDVLPKPVSLTQCKELLDGLIKEQISVQKYWSGIESILRNEGVPEKKIRALEKRVVTAAKRHAGLSGEDVRGTVGTAIKSGTAVVVLVDKIITLWKLFGS